MTFEPPRQALLPLNLEAPALASAPAAPKLLDRVRHAIRVRHYSPRTEESYVLWIRRFILFHDKRHPDTMGEAEVARFLTSLAVEHKVSATTQTNALSAILFLYRHVLRHRELGWMKDIVRARAPKPLPVVLTREEVRAVLDQLTGTPRLAAALLYGTGLRVLEALQLRIKDIDFGANQITVRGGKGHKDRLTMLPTTLKEPLRRHIQDARRQHEQDLALGAGWVEMPMALDRKYVNAGREWPWQWVFPATRHYVDRTTRQRRRHHLHETVLQRAVHDAVRKARLAKHATCHTFRHSFATHLLQGVALLPCHPEGTEAPAAWVSRAT